DPAGEATDDALGRVEAERLGPQLAHALGSLPARDREALLLLAWGGLDYEGIARALDVPVGTVRSRIHSARPRLQPPLSRGGLARPPPTWGASGRPARASRSPRRRPRPHRTRSAATSTAAAGRRSCAGGRCAPSRSPLPPPPRLLRR